MTASQRVRELALAGKPAGLAIWLAAQEYGISASALAARLRIARRTGWGDRRRMDRRIAVNVNEWWDK